MTPRRVILCIDRFDAPGGKVWAVRTGKRWITARTVNVEIDMETVFKGQHARQPKAYLSGFGVVHDNGRGTVTIRSC